MAGTGGAQVRRTLKITAAAGQTRAEQQAAFVQSPRIGNGLLKVAGPATGVLVVAGSVLGAALLGRGGRPAAQPTRTPSPPASSSWTPWTPPNKATIVDFGKEHGDQLVPADRYSKQGITLSTVLERAPEQCAEASASALRTVTGLGAFLTSARPAGVDLCTTVPVRVDLAAPACTVRTGALSRSGLMVVYLGL
ncbi:hypothetical protein [Streptomyces sp. NPDC013455]|uniref:hypothetical protein n=1 Tax=Streptomyces sp. NPDC013455 TaxID=3155605 RepID=UPI003400A090